MCDEYSPSVNQNDQYAKSLNQNDQYAKSINIYGAKSDFGNFTKNTLSKEQPQLNETDLTRLAEIVKQEKELKAQTEKLKDEKDEITHGLMDDPFFANNKSFDYEKYGIRIICTQPTVKDAKWIKKGYETINKNLAELKEYEEDFKQNGIRDFKSKPTIQIKSMK
jgi:hypothetical protein